MAARSYKMKVTTVDRNGRRKGPVEWVQLPAAQRFVADGIANIEPFVSRLLSSSRKSASIIISSVSGRSAISISKHDGEPLICLTVDVGRPRTREAAVRRFFSDRQISPQSDYLGGNGGVPNTVRLLEYPLPPQTMKIVALASDVLRSLYRISNSSALHITYQEAG